MTMLSRSALMRLTNRKVLQVKGVDAHRFLQGILTNDMKNVAKPQDAIYGAFLTVKGRVLGDCNIVQVEADTFLLDYDAALNDDMTKHWKRYKLRMKVVLEDMSDRLSAFAALPVAIAATDKQCVDASEQVQALLKLNEREPSATHGAVFGDPRGDTFGVRAILPSADQLNTSGDYTSAELHEYTDRRIFLGAAEGSELSDAIPLEADLELLHGVSFRKGCYVGQELTARTQFKGNVRKRFVPVALIHAGEVDLVKELSEQPFQRIDCNDKRSLREFLQSDTRSIPVPEEPAEMAIMRPDSTKSAGSVVVRGNELGAAIAMMRLEHLLPKEDGDAPLMQFTTADGAFHVIPYQPTWWPQLDAKTGKMAL